MGRKSNGDVHYSDAPVWQEPVTVPCCDDIIWSTWQGHYEQCECGRSAVDQTEHYSRLIGAVCCVDPRFIEPQKERERAVVEQQFDWIDNQYKAMPSKRRKAK